ncbi:MAG TPA: hypothetical protein DCW68_03190 [Rhodospirillaceae bacterium]|nr:MAG: hypothetical protein A2018_06165 [Alphaproteobacteria bacterium GWF2_58_20]HAU29097.1 hypothetical protein [Rhodospirillaceae bacterium]
MGFSVNTNNEAMSALRLLTETNKSLSTVQARINSGYKVGSARDNASTFTIAQGMRADISAFEAVNDSLSMGEATANVAVQAATKISNKLIDLQTEVVNAQSSTVDRAKIQESISKLVSDIDGIVSSAQFNGYNLINNTDANLSVTSSLNRTDPTTFSVATITVNREDLRTATLGISGINVADGSGKAVFESAWAGTLADNDTFTITAGGSNYVFEFIEDPATTAATVGSNFVVDMDTAASPGANIQALMSKMAEVGFTASYNSLGEVVINSSNGSITAVASSNGDVTTSVVAAGDPSAALTSVANAITTVNSALARLSSSANQVGSQKDFVQELTDALTSGVGSLVDADLAEESAQLQALQTKQQLGIQALSIANQQPSTVLSLFR